MTSTRCSTSPIPSSATRRCSGQDNPGDDDYWVMGVARRLAREAEFYKSYDLKDWSFLSSFGPANAVGGIWEVPDTHRDDGREPGETKYLLIENLNPGGVAGGRRRSTSSGIGTGHRHAENIRTAGRPGDVVFEGIEVRLRRLDARGSACSNTAMRTGAIGGVVDSPSRSSPSTDEHAEPHRRGND